MSTVRVSIVKTALVVVALAATGRSDMVPSSFPTAPTAPSVCEGSTPGFRDSYGDSCQYYEMNDLPGCPKEGDLYAAGMGTAREHCCYCWMGAPTSSPTSSPTVSTSPTLAPATSAPTVSTSPTLTPTSMPTICEGSTPGFRDSYSDGCEWYEMNELPGCPKEGDLYAGPMGTARENCCYCWMDAPTSAPTSTPTVSMTPTLTPELNEPVLCQGSTPNFRDSHGDGCEWYEMADEPGCPHHGNHYEGAMGVANDHCCYCKMTSSPTPSPPNNDGYEYMGSGYCTSADEIEDPFNQDPFVNNGLFGFDYTHAWEASTLEECKSACAAEHSNDPLFRGVTWMDPYACYCLKGWEGEEVRAGEITGVIDLFLDDVLCYAFTLEPTENQESATTETPGEAISGL